MPGNIFINTLLKAYEINAINIAYQIPDCDLIDLLMR